MKPRQALRFVACSVRMEKSQIRPKAVLVGVPTQKISDAENLSSLEELRRLVDTLGYDVIVQLSQKRPSQSQATVLGKGKLLELARWTGGPGTVQPAVKVKRSKAAEKFDREDEDGEEPSDELSESDQKVQALLSRATSRGEKSELVIDLESDDGAISEDFTGPPEGVVGDIIIFDCDLSPSQLRNLESATGVPALDRTGVIIEIFSRHARTRAAHLQVEIARLKYMAPRIRETTGGADRQGGGIGAKGAGESAQELDRRRIRDRLKELKQDLAAVQTESDVRRFRRTGENCVALIGYTNAGKSSLMRALTGSEILVADKLFATLDTTVRPLSPPTMPRVLVSDTVGFIKKLPHDLVASFKSTLDEALNADLLLYVVDISDATFRMQLEVTRQVITEIGAHTAPSLLLFNKRDRLTPEEMEPLAAEFPEAIFLSTRDAEDLNLLRDRLVNFFEEEMAEEDLHVPYRMNGAIGEIRKSMRVVSEAYDEAGVSLKVKAKPEDLARFRRRFANWEDEKED